MPSYRVALYVCKTPRSPRRWCAVVRCCDCGFESRRVHGYLSLWEVCVVRYRSLRRADCLSRGDVLRAVLSECDLETSTMRRSGPTGAVEPWNIDVQTNRSTNYAYICGSLYTPEISQSIINVLNHVHKKLWMLRERKLCISVIQQDTQYLMINFIHNIQ